jgi:hypothetical protein
MGQLLLGNIEPGTTDDEIREFLDKYGFPPIDSIEHVPGDGSRPAVMLTFESAGNDALRKLKHRIHHIFWKKRELNVFIVGDHLS